MRRGGPHARVFLGFATVQVVVSLAYFVVLPVLASASDRGQWAAIAVGQSVGFLVAYAVDCGWSLVGPAEVATSATRSVRQLFVASVWSRMLVFSLAAPMSLLAVCLLVTPTHRVIGMLMCLAVGVGGFSPAWLTIGLRSPRLLVTYEAVPRLAAAVIAAVAIIRGAAVVVYPVLLVSLTVVGLVLCGRRILRDHGSTDRQQVRATLGSVWTDVRRNMRATGSVLAAGAYASATPALAAMVIPAGGVASYSSGERMYKFGLLAIVAVANSLQGWVFDDQGRPDVDRMRSALRIHVGLGIVGAIALGLAVPEVTRIAFGSNLQAPYGVGVWLGIAFLAVSVNSALGRHVLIPRGRTRSVTTSTLVGACLGVPLILLLAETFGSTGVAAGLALSEVTVALVQLRAVLGHRLLERLRLA